MVDYKEYNNEFLLKKIECINNEFLYCAHANECNHNEVEVHDWVMQKNSFQLSAKYLNMENISFNHENQLMERGFYE